MKSPNGHRRRFSLVEVLAALLIVATVVPVVTMVLRNALRTSENGTRRLQAAELGSNLLDGWRAEGTWNTQPDSGTFDDVPGYRWTLERKSWDGDSLGRMTELDLRVYYPVQGQEQSVVLATLMAAETTTSSASSSSSSSSGGGS